MNWLLTKILRYIGKRLNGYKTKLAGVGFILNGVTGLLGEMFPDQGLPKYGTEASTGLITFGLGMLGVGGKMDKQKNETVALTQATEKTNALIEKQNEILLAMKPTTTILIPPPAVPSGEVIVGTAEPVKPVRVATDPSEYLGEQSGG